VIEEIVDHISLSVDGGTKLPYRVLESFNPLHHLLYLVRPITNIPLKGVIPIGVPCWGGGPCSTAEPRRTVRLVGTTTLLVLWVTTPIPSVPLGLLRGAYGAAAYCCAASMWAHYRVWGGPEYLRRASSIRVSCNVSCWQEYSASVGLGNWITLLPPSYNIEME
jgi:hypothetical protein